MAFVSGDILASVVLYVNQPDWMIGAELVGIKLAVILVSGFIGGGAGYAGKELVKACINRIGKQ